MSGYFWKRYAENESPILSMASSTVLISRLPRRLKQAILTLIFIYELSRYFIYFLFYIIVCFLGNHITRAHFFGLILDCSRPNNHYLLGGNNCRILSTEFYFWPSAKFTHNIFQAVGASVLVELVTYADKISGLLCCASWLSHSRRISLRTKLMAHLQTEQACEHWEALMVKSVHFFSFSSLYTCARTNVFREDGAATPCRSAVKTRNSSNWHLLKEGKIQTKSTSCYMYE